MKYHGTFLEIPWRQSRAARLISWGVSPFRVGESPVRESKEDWTQMRCDPALFALSFVIAIAGVMWFGRPFVWCRSGAQSGLVHSVSCDRPFRISCLAQSTSAARQACAMSRSGASVPGMVAQPASIRASRL